MPKPPTRLSDPREAQAYARQVARHRGWVLNPDETLTAPVIRGLATQSARFGRPFCPCRDVDGTEDDRDVVCPCVYAVADIDDHGQCYCGLFLGLGKDPGTVGSIPERRP